MSLPGGIDFGDQQPKRGGALMMLVGAAIAIAGILGVAYGIGQAIGQAGAIKDDAVARGFVRADPGESIAFETPTRKLSVYLDFDGLTNNSEVQDDVSAITGCEVTAQDGSVRAFSGARQGTATTIGDLVSVGSFEMPTPSGRIRCAYLRNRDVLSRPDAVPFLLTPHSTGEIVGPILLIVGCVFGAICGGVLFFVGRARRNTARRLESL